MAGNQRQLFLLNAGDLQSNTNRNYALFCAVSIFPLHLKIHEISKYYSCKAKKKIVQARKIN